MAVSVICDTRDMCSLRALFLWPLHLLLTLHSSCSRSELYCSFFSQSVSQQLLQPLLQSLLQPLPQSLQFRDRSATQSSNRLITTAIVTATATFQRSLSQSTNQSINQPRPPTAITYQGLLPANLSPITSISLAGE